MKAKNTVLLAILIIALIYFLGVNISLSQVTDIDGNTYKTVKIGTQEWTAENLNVEHYRNGDVIPQVKDADVWSKLTTGAWCYYENNFGNGKTYGKLYNWYAVNDSRGLAPEGWHIPSDAEWTKLINFLGGEEVAGGKLKDTTLWNSPNTGATNESGFSAFPGGARRASMGLFFNIGQLCYFWSASSHSSGQYDTTKWIRILYFNKSDAERINIASMFGFSVRCLRD